METVDSTGGREMQESKWRGSCGKSFCYGDDEMGSKDETHRVDFRAL